MRKLILLYATISVLVSCTHKVAEKMPITDSTVVAVDSLLNENSIGDRAVKDIDDNVYKTVTIGTQVWMAENLKVTHYNNGDPIPNITEASEWAESKSSGAYCWYENNDSNKISYGALYNWYAVNVGKLAPIGWHIPTIDEWEVLEKYLAVDQGIKLREKGELHWKYSNTAGTNETGFTALPGGYVSEGFFVDIEKEGTWWSTTEYEDNRAAGISLMGDKIINPCSPPKYWGISVRCIKDDSIYLSNINNPKKNHSTINENKNIEEIKLPKWLLGAWRYDIQPDGYSYILFTLSSDMYLSYYNSVYEQKFSTKIQVVYDKYQQGRIIFNHNGKNKVLYFDSGDETLYMNMGNGNLKNLYQPRYN